MTFSPRTPVLRSRMNDNNLYIPYFEIGKSICSDGVSDVVESKHLAFPVGAIVTGMAPKKVETIYISTASGTFGKLVIWSSKFQGLFLFGSAGPDDKVEYLR
ncbi:hypothetical protein BGZ92_011932 [Podila epicladia]|nr:hypothetical protein BGZ92_011932 [Podila epicladia]